MITRIRNSFDGSVEVYTQGSCFHFCNMLAFLYPEGEAYHDCNHAIFRLGDRYYDITGEVDGSHHLPITSYKPLSNYLKYKATVKLL